MTDFQLYTLIISGLSACVSVWALINSHLVSRRQLEFEEESARLVRKQLKEIELQEESKKHPELSVQLIGSGNSYVLRVENIGHAPAREVKLEFREKGMPIASNEFRDKIPIPELRSGQAVDFSALRTTDSDSKYEVTISWINPDGSPDRDKIVVYW